MANHPAGTEGDKVTDGVQVRAYIGPKQYQRLKALWLSRSQEADKPLTLSQIIREILEAALAHPPPDAKSKRKLAMP